jgi:hypothetical protein
MPHSQLSLDLARAARDDGMARAVTHAEDDQPGWGEVALVALGVYAASLRQRTFTSCRRMAPGLFLTCRGS